MPAAAPSALKGQPGAPQSGTCGLDTEGCREGRCQGSVPPIPQMLLTWRRTLVWVFPRGLFPEPLPLSSVPCQPHHVLASRPLDIQQGA